MTYKRYEYRAPSLNPLQQAELRIQDALDLINDLKTENAELREQLREAKQKIGTLRSRIWHFKNRRKPRQSHLKAVANIQDYSGPEGLKAAADEAHNYYLRKRAAA